MMRENYVHSAEEESEAGMLESADVMQELAMSAFELNVASELSIPGADVFELPEDAVLKNYVLVVYHEGKDMPQDAEIPKRTLVLPVMIGTRRGYLVGKNVCQRITKSPGS